MTDLEALRQEIADLRALVDDHLEVCPGCGPDRPLEGEQRPRLTHG
ncbi:MAG: hypothetical protein ACR2MN_13725 [Acidimicrobiales bacterium]